MVRPEVVGVSWILDKLGSQLLSDAWAVYQRISTNTPLPRRLSERIGPPLLHPLDPRYEYLEQADLDSAFEAAEEVHATTLKKLVTQRAARAAAAAAVKAHLGSGSKK